MLFCFPVWMMHICFWKIVSWICTSYNKSYASEPIVSVYNFNSVLSCEHANYRLICLMPPVNCASNSASERTEVCYSLPTVGPWWSRCKQLSSLIWRVLSSLPGRIYVQNKPWTFDAFHLYLSSDSGNVDQTHIVVWSTY